MCFLVFRILYTYDVVIDVGMQYVFIGSSVKFGDKELKIVP